jgi:hypothetical protein
MMKRAPALTDLALRTVPPLLAPFHGVFDCETGTDCA